MTTQVTKYACLSLADFEKSQVISKIKVIRFAISIDKKAVIQAVVGNQGSYEANMVGNKDVKKQSVQGMEYRSMQQSRPNVMQSQQEVRNTAQNLEKMQPQQKGCCSGC